MPATFLLFLYIVVSGATLLLISPMLLSSTQDGLAKKIIATVLISFPCLVIAGTILTIIFLPLWVFFGAVIKGGYLIETPKTIVMSLGAVLYVASVGMTGLYLWFFASKIIYQRIDGNPVEEFLEGDWIFQKLRPLLFKLRIARRYTADIYESKD